MKNTEKIYNELKDKLSKTQPKLSNPEELTDSILNAINLVARSNSYRVLFWIRPMMSAAALFLLGLFLYQKTDENVQHSNVVILDRPIIKSSLISDNCFIQKNNENQDSKNQMRKFKCYLKQTGLKNQKSKIFLMKYISKYQKNSLMSIY